MLRMFSVEGATVQLVINGSTPMRALSSECTPTINALRGKLDNKRRWQLAVLTEEIPAGRVLRPGQALRVGGVSGYVAAVEDTDLVEDSGITTFFAS